jgi:hypothetical protein
MIAGLTLDTIITSYESSTTYMVGWGLFEAWNGEGK